VRIGGFRLEEAVPPSEFDPTRHLLPSATFFEKCDTLERVTARPDWVRRISRGAPLTGASFEDPPPRDGDYGVFSPESKLLAIVEKRGAGLRYAAVFAESDA
jgi:hypothetical protein